MGRLIERDLRDVKVVYTRTSDHSSNSPARTNPNQAGGIIHQHSLQSMPHKSRHANGFEIYLLRPGSPENALRIRARELRRKYEQGYEQRSKQLTRKISSS